MVYDCFLFNNEFEILDIRLHELSSVVDKFVLVESTVTHTNKQKKLHFLENKSRFKKFQNKIIHIIVKDTPDVNLAWIINDYQFSQMMRGLKNCKPDDVILIGDLDEIPKAEKVSEWKDRPGSLKIFEQILCYYFLNCVEYANPPWQGTRMILYKNLLGLRSTWIAKFSKVDVVIPQGGWHFSYMGGVKKIQQKIAAQAHQEYNNEHYNTPEKIAKAMLEKKDIYNHGNKFKIASEDLLPLYVRNNKEKFRNLIYSSDTKRNFLNYVRLYQLSIFEYLRSVGRIILKK